MPIMVSARSIHRYVEPVDRRVGGYNSQDTRRLEIVSVPTTPVVVVAGAVAVARMIMSSSSSTMMTVVEGFLRRMDTMGRSLLP